MRVLIYGGGSVGLGIASCLVRAGVRTDILAREETAACLKAGGLVRKGIFGEFCAAPEAFGCTTRLAAPAEGAYDFILVCTKSYDTAAAARELRVCSGCVDERTRIVLFQNGWGNAEVFAGYFPAAQVFNARVITGFERPRPNVVMVTVHADAIHIGSLFGAQTAAVEPLCAAIAAGGIPCGPTEEIGRDLWAKMLYNCALNPLGAILNVPYGKLAADASSRFLMDRIAGEVFEAMAAAGFGTHWDSAEGFLEVFYGRLVPDTAGHKSSMLQDIRAGRRTEIEALSGAVLRLGERHRIAVPFNTAVYQLIKFMEPKG